MERCNKRSLARGIKRTLEHFDKRPVIKKEECDWMMYAFARLHGIGVIPTIDEALRTEYTFFNNPEVICNFDKMRLGFDSMSINIFWENVNSELLNLVLERVTEKLNLRDWRLYLESSATDWDPMGPSHILTKCTLHNDGDLAIRYGINSIISRTGGPSREALERMFRTSQYDVDVAGMHPKFSDDILNYMKKDVESTVNLYKRLEKEKKNAPINWSIKRVIFHDPATIIYWNDGTKTVVKTQNGEKFDPEKGMAMAICKKANCNDSSYYEAFKEFLPKEEKLPSGVLNFMECLTVFATIQNLEIVGPQPETGVIRIIDKRNSDKHYHLVVERDTILEEKWQELRESMLNYFKKSPITGLPKDLEESTDAVTIDTEAEQYTGEAPKVRMCVRTIDEELKEFAEVVGLRVIYNPIDARYYISDNYPANKVYAYRVESPEKKLPCLEWAKLQHDILEYFDI